MQPCTVIIRWFTPADRAHLESLLAPDVNNLWFRQFFSLHGAASARTLIAERAGEVVGAASVLHSDIHPRGSACAIDVHSAHRCQGIGTTLLQAIRTELPDAFPLRTKVGNEAAEHFVRKHGGQVYQVSNGEMISLGNPANLAWAMPPPPGVTVEPAVGIEVEVLLNAFVELYFWQHADWNPVGSLPALRAVLAAELDEMDWSASVVAWQDGRIVALALAFPAEDGALEVVAETTVRNQLGGHEMLAATIAFLVQHASALASIALSSMATPPTHTWYLPWP